MITGPFPAPLLVMVPDSHFYCPFPVLWGLMLGCFGLGIAIGYRRAETWRQLHTLLRNLIYRLLTA